MSTTPLLYLVALASLTAYLLLQLLSPRPRDGEPPYIPPNHPPFGHLIGLVRHYMRYIVEIARSNPDCAIFTLPLPLTRVYVVGSPGVLPEIDRNGQTLNLWHIEAEVLANLGGLNRKTARVLKQQDFHEPFRRSITKSLTTTALLNELNNTAAIIILREISSLKHGQHVQLWSLVKRAITRATMAAVYGPLNPYASPEIEEAAWDLINATHVSTTGPLMRFFAPKAVSGREKVVSAMQTYFTNGGISQASPLAQGRKRVMESSNLTLPEQARLETTFSFGLVGNTSPVAFWTLCTILTTPSLLSSIRDEITTSTTPPRADSPISSSPSPSSNPSKITLPLPHLHTLPLLNATINEVLRFSSTSSGARKVLADTPISLPNHPPRHATERSLPHHAHCRATSPSSLGE